MTKGFENNRVVPIASRRLQAVGGMERHAVHPERAAELRQFPLMYDGAMMTAQNWDAYIQRKREAWKAEQRQKGLARAAMLRQRKASVTGVTKGSE